MPYWRCESCGAVYDEEVAVCQECGEGIVTRQSTDEAAVGGRLGGVTDSEKVETFDAWGIVDWIFLGLILSALASTVLGLLQSLGGP